MLSLGERAFLFITMAYTDDEQEFLTCYKKLTSGKGGSSTWFYIEKIKKREAKQELKKLKEEKLKCAKN